MYLLLVEDDDPKRLKLAAFLTEHFQDVEIGVAKSVRSAVQSLRERQPAFVLLDMSLPTFDIGGDEPGGRPQGFGGKEVLRYMARYGSKSPTIVVTGFEAFVNESNENIDLDSLDKELKSKYNEFYVGLIYFNSLYDDWRKGLHEKIREAGFYQ